MDQITEIQCNIQGSFSGNRGDNSVFGNDNVIEGTHAHDHITNFAIVNRGGPSRDRDGSIITFLRRFLERANMLSEPKETSRPYWIVPYSRNSTFTGHNRIIESVKRYCESRGHHRVALQGLGGCGKSQIALEYVYQRVQESGCHVFWTHGSGMLKFSQDFRTIGQRVHIPQASTQSNEEQFLLSVKAWFEGPDSGDWTLVIDNADHDDFLSNKSPIAKLVPQGNKGTVIFTTRSLKAAYRQECTVIEVEKMAAEEALELFSKRFHGWDGLEDEERKVVPTILESLDYLPLAVVGAAAFMTETTTPPSEYWSIFRMDESGREKLLLRELSDIRREADVTGGILSTYFITFERITKQMPTAAHLLRLIAFFDRQNIPEELLSQCGLEGIDDSIEFREAIGKLLGFSLVTYVKREGKRFYELHHLVQLSICAYLSPEELDYWKFTALRVVSRLFPRDQIDWRYGGIAAAYVPHALAVTKESTDLIAKDLIFCVGSFFLHRGAYRGAEAILQRALEGCEKVLGPDYPETLRSVNNLALALQALGRYRESETMLRRALKGFEKALGLDHPNTLTSVCNLAGVLEDQRKYDESEKMWRRTLEAREQALGPDHDEVYKTLEHLAGLYEKQREYSQAEEVYERIYTGFSKTLGKQHPTTLWCIRKLKELREAKSVEEMWWG